MILDSIIKNHQNNKDMCPFSVVELIPATYLLSLLKYPCTFINLRVH